MQPHSDFETVTAQPGWPQRILVNFCLRPVCVCCVSYRNTSARRMNGTLSSLSLSCRLGRLPTSVCSIKVQVFEELVQFQLTGHRKLHCRSLMATSGRSEGRDQRNSCDSRNPSSVHSQELVVKEKLKRRRILPCPCDRERHSPFILGGEVWAVVVRKLEDGGGVPGSRGMTHTSPSLSCRRHTLHAPGADRRWSGPSRF